MSSRYRVDYALKEHRRDEFIQWIKALLATPFVLYAVKPNLTITAVQDLMINSDAARRYAEIFHDIEKLVIDHMEMTKLGNPKQSRLSQLVSSVGVFFTKLPLEQAFYIMDQRRGISKRRLVAPSFNDIRLILNTAQILQLAMPSKHKGENGQRLLKLVTFDGDITLYDDGKNFDPESPLLGYIITLLSKNIVIGIVTAAGYKDADKYHERLGGLIQGIQNSNKLTDSQRENLLVMGGEANFLFRYNNEIKGLNFQEESSWLLPDMESWNEEDINIVLDFAQEQLESIICKLSLPAFVVRKERAVGLVPKQPLIREQLEEVVLRVDHNLRQFDRASKLKWCAFNGGSDIWIDIGDKSLGVKILQNFLGRRHDMNIGPENTLHVGDQFASLGSNDYASRTAATTAWIASPQETCTLLKDLVAFIDDWASY